MADDSTDYQDLFVTILKAILLWPRSVNDVSGPLYAILDFFYFLLLVVSFVFVLHFICYMAFQIIVRRLSWKKANQAYNKSFLLTNEQFERLYEDSEEE